MALSLAACGSDDTTTATTTTTTATTTTTTTTAAADTLTLTAGPDNLTGGAGVTTINALTEGHLEAGDVIAGGAGADTLIIRDYDSSAGSFASSSVETININFATTAMTLDLSDVTDLTSVIVDSSVADANLAEVESGHALTLANIGATATSVDVTFTDDEFVGTADSYSLTLDDVDQSLTLSLDTFGTSVEGIETLNIDVGSTKNSAVITLDTEGANAETVVITGSAQASFIGFTSGTINAADATGNLTVELAAEETTVTMGSGNDTIDVGTTLTYEDTINGGAGTNTLKVTTGGTIALSSASTGQVANVSNITTIRFDDEITADTTIDMSKISGLLNVDFDDFADGGDDQLVVSNLLDGATVTVDGSAGTAADANSDLELNFAANSANNDVTLALEGLTMGILANTDGYLDDVTITSATATNLISVISGFTAKSITATGAAALDVNGSALSTATTTFDASAMTADVDVTASATGTTISTGSGADNILGGAGADIISAGAGIDDIDGAAGNNTLTGGTGADVFMLGGGTDTVTDFEVGASGDDVKFTLADLNALGTDLHMWDSTDPVAASDTISDSVNVVSGQFDLGTLGADIVMLQLNADFTAATKVETAIEVGGSMQLTSDATYADDDIFLLMWDDGSHSYLSTVKIGTAANWTANGTIDANDSTVTNIATFSGITDCTTILAAQFTDIA
jgi:hypothetical protein